MSGGGSRIAAAVIALACLLGPADALAQPDSSAPPVSAMDMHEIALAPAHTFFDATSHVLVGVLAALAGVFGQRAWSRRRWRRAPAATVIEAVLAVDLVNSTLLATRHGESLAMRARNVLERRAVAAAEPQGVTFVENTGDGCMMTFPSAIAAARAAAKLLQGLRDRSPDMTPAPPLEVRVALAYGEMLLDARGVRHGAVINKAFRLMSVPREAFVIVEAEERMDEIPDCNRIFLDEDAANELTSGDARLRQVGVCRLKGFSGFHRVYAFSWDNA